MLCKLKAHAMSNKAELYTNTGTRSDLWKSSERFDCCYPIWLDSQLAIYKILLSHSLTIVTIWSDFWSIFSILILNSANIPHITIVTHTHTHMHTWTCI